MGQAARQKQETGIERRPAGYGGVTRLEPFSLFNNFRTEMDRLFDDFGFGVFPAMRGFTADALNWAPQTEVFRRDDRLVVRADLPGMTKDDVNIDINNDTVTIRGERKSEHEDNKEGIYRTERSYGSFFRSIPLPDGADGDQANAKF